ncbi:hypothetical protein GCM10023160_14020 [Brachybacterium paraconglomeratum]|uniref:DUF3152 domain-containing protein n=1 Tax=Brachybacterium paraconglomeratum TaxID=173362 RepID=UPI0031EF8FA4
MTLPPAPRPQLRLTRRGRLVRTGLVLLLCVLLVLTLVAVVRALGGDGEAQRAGTSSPTALTAAEGPLDGGGATAGAPTPESEGDGPVEGEAMVRTGTVGAGTWTFAAPSPAPAVAEGRTVRTYAVRVEDGIEVSADEASSEIARVLADPRGWQEIDNVSFRQVATAEEAEFTISLGSPPTVDALCLPAKTGGTWSCRIGPDVALNSDRWLHATPTYDDLVEYRAYMINHEVGHFLGHEHARCGGAEQPAPVMLQQSMDLEGCTPNAWPATNAPA